MNTFILGLTDFYSRETFEQLKEKGITVIWNSHLITKLIAVSTDLSREEVKKLPFITDARPVEEGSFDHLASRQSPPPAPSYQPDTVVYRHENFGELSKFELDSLLSFLAQVMQSVDAFTVSEAENNHREEDNERYQMQAIEHFESLVKEKEQLDNLLLP